jgi:KipI family sensor histidine kinase inhibitor
MSEPVIEALGDGALLIRLGGRIELAANRAALDLAAALRAAALPGIGDIAPAYASVCVRYDIAAWSNGDARSSAFDHIAARLQDLLAAARAEADADPAAQAPIEIPVCYGGEFGPDLDAVAVNAGLAAGEIVARHAQAEYRVAMLGFMPGFPYLLGLDPALHMPRRASPRTRVPAGSVAIGGGQTGIYPRELPGGWQLIGRTPLTLFDPARAEPALLRPGQRVRFRAIDAAQFAALAP